MSCRTVATLNAASRLVVRAKRRSNLPQGGQGFDSAWRELLFGRACLCVRALQRVRFRVSGLGCGDWGEEFEAWI